ncbi:MAG: glycosyltransferase [Elusimicrobia bacterium]|nr:glycosyltransferase [Elusimicrobiota bacterium]MBD3411978.1 glycosyltransferase [Elusimicrobiota bacterium]
MILILPAVFCWFIGFWILFRIPVCTTETTVKNIPRVSVIIPARNEEKTIPRLIHSLHNQTVKPYEVIVVDDHSEDRTRAVALQNNVRVVTSQPLPSGWLGKPWACHQGAREAQGDILVFLDADAFMEHDGFQKLITTLSAQNAAISVNPYHRISHAYESFSAFFNIMQMVGMDVFSMKKNVQPAGMFGPCLMISRADYVRCGGHESVKHEILEHYALGRQLKAHGIQTRLYGGRGCVNVQLYPDGISSLIQGWSKSFAAGAHNTSKHTMRLSGIWISGLIMAPIVFMSALVIGHASLIPVTAVVYSMYCAQIFIHLRRLGNFSWWASVLYPVLLVFFLILFVRADYRLRKKRIVEWKGRNIAVK